MMSSENKQHLKKAIKGLVTEEWAGQRDSEAPRDHQEREAGTHPPGPRAWGRARLLCLPPLAGRFFTASATWEALVSEYLL